VRYFAVLEHLGLDIGAGAVVCLTPKSCRSRHRCMRCQRGWWHDGRLALAHGDNFQVEPVSVNSPARTLASSSSAAIGLPYR
jgi:hypothetical protein